MADIKMDKTDNKSEIELEREKQEQEANIACAILKGAKTADVAAVNGLKYAACREMLHKHCRRVNPEAYELINIDAAVEDCHSPFLEQLRANKHKFIAVSPESRSPEQLRRDIDERKERVTTAQITLRSERSILNQLEAELAAVMQQK